MQLITASQAKEKALALLLEKLTTTEREELDFIMKEIEANMVRGFINKRGKTSYDVAVALGYMGYNVRVEADSYNPQTLEQYYLTVVTWKF